MMGMHNQLFYWQTYITVSDSELINFYQATLYLSMYSLLKACILCAEKWLQTYHYSRDTYIFSGNECIPKMADVASFVKFKYI